MAGLSSKVQDALDEGRILILGTQVLLGFEYRSFFEHGFPSLPGWVRALKLGALCVMLSALALLVLPAAFHRLAERGEDTRWQLRLTTRAVGLALLPLALGLGLDVIASAEPVVGARGGVALGAICAAMALGCWYGWTELARRRHARARGEEDEEMAPSSLQNRIQHVLTEARMMLPGAQALLGFGLAAVLTEGFERLPRPAQLVHLATIVVTCVVIVLLVAPAAYHRIVEGGEETERFHRVATRLLIASLTPLALALAAQLGVVTYVLTRAVAPSIAAGVAAALALHGVWFGVTFALRTRRRGRPPPPLGRAAARA